MEDKVKKNPLPDKTNGPFFYVEAHFCRSGIGGEVIADACAITGDRKHLDCAKRFRVKFVAKPGGQIENIARMQTIEYILSGKQASIVELENYCKAEKLTKNTQRSVVGFR